MNAPTRRIVRTMCPMNCHPTLCGMKAEVEGDRLLGIVGDETNPESRGLLCMRGEAAHEIIGNPKRLTRPLMRDRRDGEWREASWDEAMGRIEAAMRAAAPHETGIWGGHGLAVNDYGVGVKGQLLARLANLWGAQYWSGAMICWGMGGFGFGITGAALETSTKPDMAENAAMVILWGANFTSQKNTSPYVVAARERGAKIVVIDVRRTEAMAMADEKIVLRPGSDTALALAMAHVILRDGLADEGFLAEHTVGAAEFRDHVRQYTPEWAAAETGLEADRIEALARAYGTTRPATIVAGGSSLHKGRNAWHAARAIACLPALVGDYGVPGGGFGTRHGVHSHGRGLGDIKAADRRRPGPVVPEDMEAMMAAWESGQIKVLLTPGANILTSFADANRAEAALARVDLVVCHDLFMSETARKSADIILPSTSWLEEVGVKATERHLHLCDTALPAPGEARPIYQVARDLADRLGIDDFHPWADHEGALDALLDHPSTGGVTIASMRANGGRAALKVSPVSYEARRFDTPSGKIEFVSERARDAGLPALPVAPARAEADPAAPLTLAQGRAWTHFHSFYDQGRALPALVEREPHPELWISPADAEARGVARGDAVRIANARGVFEARAKVTKQVPPGTVWLHDGWAGFNALMDGTAALPEAALRFFPFSVGQSSYEAEVEVARI